MQVIKGASPSGQNESVQILQYSWKHYFEMAMAFAKALVSLGVAPRSTVLIQGENTPEHFACMMGTILANCIVADIYLTNSAEVCKMQAQHSNARVIVCDNYARLKSKFLVNASELSKVKACILFAEGLQEPHVMQY